MSRAMRWRRKEKMEMEIGKMMQEREMLNRKLCATTDQLVGSREHIVLLLGELKLVRSERMAAFVQLQEVEEQVVADVEEQAEVEEQLAKTQGQLAAMEQQLATAEGDISKQDREIDLLE
jgi:septal ring factor EnvC (AmiA/AmiB activator)